MVHSVWVFLVQNGAVSAAVKFITVGLLGGAVKLLRDLIKHQKRTNDLLDPTTPGGLGDLPGAPAQKKPIPPQ